MSLDKFDRDYIFWFALILLVAYLLSMSYRGYDYVYQVQLNCTKGYVTDYCQQTDSFRLGSNFSLTEDVMFVEPVHKWQEMYSLYGSVILFFFCLPFVTLYYVSYCSFGSYVRKV